jgi:hypothetical protein
MSTETNRATLAEAFIERQPAFHPHRGTATPICARVGAGSRERSSACWLFWGGCPTLRATTSSAA